MKRKTLTAASLFIFITASAQNNKGVGSLELTIGASVPFSKYASGETKVHNKGYAKTGESINISYSHPTKTKIGLMIMFFGQRNPLNTKALEEKYSNTPYHSLFSFGSTNPSPWPNPQPPPPEVYYKNWEFEKGAWYTASLLVGAYTTLPMSKDGKLSMTLKAGIGAAYVSSPEYKAVARTDTSVVSVLQQSNDAFGFSYSVTPGLMYTLKPGTSITFNVMYFGTAGMSFDKMKSSGRTQSGISGYPPISISSWMVTSDVQQAVNTINLSLGIRFGL